MGSRIGNLFRGFFSIFVSGLERKNPEALLENEQENLRRQITKFNAGLVSHATLVESIIGHIRKLETDGADLRAKTSANVRLQNRAAAGQYALRLQAVERELAESRVKMEQAESTYKDLVRARDVAISAARSRIEALKTGIGDMKMKRAMAELTEMASGMISTAGSSSDTLGRLETMVNEERYKASGRVRVAVDSMDASGAPIREAEQSALAEQALEQFEQKQAALASGQSRLGDGVH